MKRRFLICIALALVVWQARSSEREVILLDKGWSFIQKDIKNGEDIHLDDSEWEKVQVPHDWAIQGNFDMNIDMQSVQVIEDGEKAAKLRTGRTGALPCFGIGWYRKVLPVTTSDQGKRVFITFDGAMSLAKIYLNGEYIGEWPYGYSSFSFELTKYLKFGQENILAVRLENKPESSRWYPGAGIYRNVRLIKTSDIRIAQWGTFITTPVITKKSAELNVKTEIDGNVGGNMEVKLTTEIFNEDNIKVGTISSTKKKGEKLVYDQTLKIKDPQLWSIESPVRYYALSKVWVGNELKDDYKTVFGIRTIRFDKDKGFFLNEKPVKFKGVCMHHDLGPLGTAVNYRATERQLMLMKEMGCNAIRTSHNPPSPELLQICDSLGLMVQVEAFDEWKLGKNANGYGQFFEKWAEKDLRAMLRRDRNHPSVVIWSIGNEIREQSRPDGKETARFLTAICHESDPTRPVSSAFNQHTAAIKNGLSDVVDLVGFNYKPSDYLNKHREKPGYTLYGSETASTVSSRGEYKFPVKENKGAWYQDYQVSSYDLEYPNWASTPDTEFEMQDDCEFILGEFVWTGFDYLGEPTPYNEGTPARSSYFGIVDLAGLKKDRFYLYQSKWSEKPVLHLLPHWNWPERIGLNVPVYCYTNYPKAELFVNGVSMGLKQKEKSNKYTRYRLMWNDVVYQPGEIKVVAYDESNNAVAEQIIRTAGEPYSVRLTADRNNIRSDGKDLSFVTAEILDKNGNLCPKADNLLFFKVAGAGKLKAICNGNAIDQTSFSSSYMRTFNGKMVIIIESETEPGEISLSVSGGKLTSRQLKIVTGNETAQK